MKVGFIGVGNMGGALCKSIASNTEIELLISNHSVAKAEGLLSQLNHPSAQLMDNEQIVAHSDFVFMGLKPAMMVSMLQQLTAVANPKLTWISMAAGIELTALTDAVGQQPVIRIMPNTPVEIGFGMTTYVANEYVQSSNLKHFEAIMAPTGTVVALPESLMDAATAIAGCGPAFVYQMIEAMSDVGVKIGLPRYLAQQLTVQTLIGAAQMVEQTQKHPGALKDAVTSPGGSTIAGVTALEANGFRHAAIEAVLKAFERTQQLKEEKRG
ncbi:pyrroline-5-carboxylate reductase [Tuanshanicoccus lijuaniae]|uniref:pyrroline-5-carboxylate reductase n=1 Tax=Aerococcaceae bacterium zg-1292 TaxID=2774330 RepID=UPI001BD8B295|nr:pyrroline-5-carboxylate reductase [Aerococcaceae bacterium zg-A91]MBS4457909.1 pyrroline-5-carboxylate reductase [Aerococcaceae bacterium zg-BR33]